MRIQTTMILLAALAAACSGGGSGSGGGIVTPGPVATIAVAPVSATLNTGASMQLSATLRDARGNILQNRPVAWSTEDASKVAVTATGMVRAMSVGSARVTVTAEGRSANAQIAVVAPNPSPVSRIVLMPTSADVEEGDSLPFEATLYDANDRELAGRAVQWTTADAGIAGVDAGGLVTALRAGSTLVTARSEGREATAALRVHADYGFDLIYSRADVGEFAEPYLLDIDDPAAMPQALFPPGRRASHVTPSPDGTRIAYVLFTSTWDSLLYVSDRNSNNAATVVSMPARNDQPAWSPDGTRIAFSSRPMNGASDIWVMNPDGTNLSNLTADQAGGQRSPAWSPALAGGGYRIAYSRSINGTGQLWTMRDDGSDKRELTTDATVYDEEPTWSPDGQTIVFTRSGSAIFGDLYKVSSLGGQGRALTPAVQLPFGQFSPVFSPDGQRIAFTSKHQDGDHYQVYTIWADGTRLAQRTTEALQHTDPVWVQSQ